MTGRRLYDALTDAWAEQSAWSHERGKFIGEVPVAWAFLAYAERATFNLTARKLTPKPRPK